MTGSVRISQAAEADIRRHAEDSADGRETGGILLGHGPDPRGAIHVQVAGDAGPAAIREPARFARDLAHAKRLADDAWQTRRAIWVGEWHTHLHGDPRPSDVDLAIYADLLTASHLAFDRLVSVIVTPAADGGWATALLHAWVLQIAPSSGEGCDVLHPD